MASNDKDLDKLLDDALEDFEKPPKSDKEKAENWTRDFLQVPKLEARLKLDQKAKMTAPPNSFVDSSAFDKAMEQQMKELNRLSQDDNDDDLHDDLDEGKKLEDLFAKINPPPEDLEKLLSHLQLNNPVPPNSPFPNSPFPGW